MKGASRLTENRRKLAAYLHSNTHRTVMLYIFLSYLTLQMCFGTGEKSDAARMDAVSLGFVVILVVELCLRIFAVGWNHFWYQPNDYFTRKI